MTLERYKELKDKGWKTLSHVERTEYKELKDKYGDDLVKAHFEQTVEKADVPVDAVLEGDKDDKIILKRSELEELIAKSIAKEKEKTVSGAEPSLMGIWKEKKSEKQNMPATLRKYQKDSDSPEGLVIDMKHHKWKKDPRTMRMNVDIYKFKLLYDDGTTEEFEAPLEEVMKVHSYEKVEIIKMEKKELEMITGYVGRPIKKDGYTMRGDHYEPAGASIPLKVTTDVYTATVKRENGQELTLLADKLNT